MCVCVLPESAWFWVACVCVCLCMECVCMCEYACQRLLRPGGFVGLCVGTYASLWVLVCVCVWISKCVGVCVSLWVCVYSSLCQSAPPIKVEMHAVTYSQMSPFFTRQATFYEESLTNLFVCVRVSVCLCVCESPCREFTSTPNYTELY